MPRRGRQLFKPKGGLMQRDEADLRWYFCEWSGVGIKSNMGAQLERLAYGQIAWDPSFQTPDSFMTEDVLEQAERANEIAAILKMCGELHTRVLERAYGMGQWRQLGLVFGNLAGVVPVTPTAREYAKRYIKERVDEENRHRAEVTAVNGKPQAITHSPKYATPRSVDDFLSDLARSLASASLPPQATKRAKRAVAEMQDEAYEMLSESNRAFEAARKAYDTQEAIRLAKRRREANEWQGKHLTASHTCRASTVYGCPCGAKRG